MEYYFSSLVSFILTSPVTNPVIYKIKPFNKDNDNHYNYIITVLIIQSGEGRIVSPLNIAPRHKMELLKTTSTKITKFQVIVESATKNKRYIFHSLE